MQASSGTTPASIPVTVNPAGLAPNTYTGTITFTYSGATLSVPVTLTVTQQQPSIQAIITTVAGTAFTFPLQPLPALNAPLLNDLRGAALDAQGNLYVADTGNNVVVKIATGGTLSIVAGVGFAGFSGDGGPATSAALDAPSGVAADLPGMSISPTSTTCAFARFQAGSSRPSRGTASRDFRAMGVRLPAPGSSAQPGWLSIRRAICSSPTTTRSARCPAERSARWREMARLDFRVTVGRPPMRA